MKMFGGNVEDSDDEKKMIAKGQIKGTKLNYDEQL